MNFSDLFKSINWRTTAFAIGYLLCNIAGGLYPAAAEVCSVLDKIFVAGGFISAADSARIDSVVQAVDHVAWKNGVDPATLQPIPVK